MTQKNAGRVQQRVWQDVLQPAAAGTPPSHPGGVSGSALCLLQLYYLDYCQPRSVQHRLRNINDRSLSRRRKREGGHKVKLAAGINLTRTLQLHHLHSFTHAR